MKIQLADDKLLIKMNNPFTDGMQCLEAVIGLWEIEQII